MELVNWGLGFGGWGCGWACEICMRDLDYRQGFGIWDWIGNLGFGMDIMEEIED